MGFLDGGIVLQLLQNVSLLALVAVGYAVIRRRGSARMSRPWLWVGILFGAGAVFAMSMRITVAPGVFVDGRSVLLGLSAIFGGVPAALIAGLVAAGFRLVIGGTTAVPGVLGSLGAALVSMAFILLRRRFGFGLNPLSLFLLGLAVITESLLNLLLFLPDQALEIVGMVAAPLYLVIPLGTVLLGLALKGEDDRLTMQSHLSEQTELLQAVFSSMSDGVSVANRHGEIILANPAAVAMTGVPATGVPVTARPGTERAESFGIYELDGVTPFPDSRMPLVRALHGETSDNVEVLMRNGVTKGDRILSVNGRPLRGADGISRGGIVVFRDITAQIAVQKALQRSEERLRDAIESISDGFALFDKDDRLVLCNAAFRQNTGFAGMDSMAGKTMEEILRHLAYSPVTDIRVGEDPEAWIRWRIERHRNPPEEPYEQHLTDGRWLHITERRTSDGGRVGIWTDITALRTLETRLQDAVANINEGFAMFDAQMRFLLVNQQFLRAYPKSAPMMVPGASMEAVLRYGAEQGEYPGIESPEAIDEFVRSWMAHYLSEEPFLGEGPLADGRWLLVSHRRTASGGYVAVRADITAQKRRESELEAAKSRMERQTADLAALAERLEVARLEADRANREKSRFLAGMSHELRTPLNAILGFADIIAQEMFGPVLPVRYREYGEMIHDSGAHLLSLLNDVLDLSKVEAGKMELRLESVDAWAFMTHIVAMMKTAATDGKIELQAVAEGGCAALHADRRAAKQIALNLVSNAIKFTPPGGRIRLRVQDAGAGGAEISVADTGIGMTPDEVAKALQPYGQIETNLEIRTKGTGLGLTLVQSLAELHGGYMNVVSEKGKGTTVSVFLPWVPGLAAAKPVPEPVAAPALPAAMPAADEPAAKGLRILLAEDNPMNQRMFVEILRHAGYQVDCVADGIAAVERAAAASYDLILMDVEMPNLDGVGAAERIRAGSGRSSAAPIIALTANEGPEYVQRYLAAGMSEVVTKPISVQALIDAVSAVGRSAA